MADAQITIVDGDQTQIVLAPGENPAIVASIPGPQGPAGAVAAAIDGSAALPSIAFASDTDTGLYRVGANQLGVSTGGTQRLVIDANGQIEATSLGTAAAPTWTFVGDPNTGIYSPGADQVAISTNGTGRLFVQSDGRIQLTTTGLGVNKASQSGFDLDVNGLSILRGATYTDTLNGISGDTTINAPSSQSLLFKNGNTERLRITSTGQLSHIGAGTSGSPAVSFSGSAPSNSLVVDGTGNVGIGGAASSNILECRSPSNSTIGITRTASHNVTLNAIAGGAFTIGLDGSGGSTERLRIDAAGRLGVGTLTPLRTLTSGGTIGELCLLGTGANGNTNTLIGRISSQVRSGSGEATSSFASIEFRTGTSSWFGDSCIAFLTNSSDGTASAGTERMRLTSTGLGVGTSAPSAPLDLYGASNALCFRIDGASGATDRALRISNSANSVAWDINSQGGSSASGVLTLSTNNTERMRIDSSGRVGIGTAAPQGTLHVIGNSSSAGTGNINISNAAFPTSGWAFRIPDSGSTIDLSLDGAIGGTFRSVMYFARGTGNVGIGTTTVNRQLVLNDNTLACLALQNSTTGNATGDGFQIQLSGTDAYIWNYETAPIAFGTNNVERARIDSSGTFRVKGAGTGGVNDAVQLNGSAPANSLLLDASGRLLVGTSSWYTIPDSRFGLPWVSGQQIKFTDSGSFGGLAIISATSSINERLADLSLNRQNGNTDYAALSNGNPIGSVTFNGADGSKFVRAASITAFVDGTPGTDDMPGRLVFSTTADGASSPTERMRITSDAYVRLASGTGGIQFNGDTAAANALDDYEEGAFTPTIEGSTSAGTGTYLNRVGTYTKIGNTVFFRVYIIWSGHTGTGDLQLSGLPFTSNSTSGYFSAVNVGSVSDVALTANNVFPGGYVATNSSRVVFAQAPVGGGTATAVPFDSAGNLIFSGHYIV